MYYIFVDLENEFIRTMADNITCSGKKLFFYNKILTYLRLINKQSR